MSGTRTSLLFLLIVLGAVSIIASGGGGGGGGGAPAPGSSSSLSVVSGVVSDGPIRNARVFLDLNYNGVYDTGEPFSITNSKGEYRIDYILDPGTQYMLIAEGSTLLGTTDPLDNPLPAGQYLQFVMFVPITSAGTRNGSQAPTSYRQDVTPTIFKGYLAQLQDSMTGVNNADVAAIIQSTQGSVALFQNCIRDKQVSLQTYAQQVAERVQSINGQADLQPTKADLGLGSSTVVDFTDKTIQDLWTSPVYVDRTLAVLGDMVISKPIAKASVVDVTLTNMNTAETTQRLTLTLKPGSLAAYDVSITEYASILEIPEYSAMRDRGDVVILGADITAKDHTGTKNLSQWLTCSIFSSNNSFAGLESFYFDGSTWISNGPVTAAMNTIRTAPFVIVKTNNLVEKTLNIVGLSQLKNAVIILKGYMASDPAKRIMTLDAFQAPQPPSDYVTVRIPANFIISEVIVVDSELKNVSGGSSSVSLPVTDTTQQTVVSTSLSTLNTKLIVDQTLYSGLKAGSQAQDFPGIGVYIDSKVVYRGIDMFLGLAIDNTVKSIITENVNRFLESSAPTFYSGSGSFPGVTIDSSLMTIKVTLSDANSTTTVTWNFEAGKVVRAYKKTYSGGVNKGSEYSSTYTLNNAKNGITNVSFRESVTQFSNNSQTLLASYEGVAIYDRSDGSLLSARFNQTLSETNIVTQKTHTLNGLAMMENGILSFNGSYSFYLPSYGTVGGSAAIVNGTYARGYNTQDATYFNNNTLQNANALFSASTNYVNPTINPAWFVGIWSGTFTDSCDPQNRQGQLTMSATDVTATWWGRSFDGTRNYGTSVELSGTAVRLKDNGALWSNSTKISDTRIEGPWSAGGCQGNVVLNKQP